MSDYDSALAVWSIGSADTAYDTVVCPEGTDTAANFASFNNIAYNDLFNLSVDATTTQYMLQVDGFTTNDGSGDIIATICGVDPAVAAQSVQDCFAANPCTLAGGACAQEIEALEIANVLAIGDSCPSEAPSGAPSSPPSVSFCTDSCMDGDGNEGIAFCTIHIKDDDKHLHNRCDTTPNVQLRPGDLDNIDEREIFSCGCCDLTVPDTTDFTEVKRSKKGAHCEAEYEAAETSGRKLSAAGGTKKNQSKNPRIRRMASL